MSAKLLLVLSLLALSGSTWAQRCPPGSPQTPACLPPDHPASPLRNQVNQQPTPRVIWADRWGAIATDAASASLGTVVGMGSKRKAEKGALAACRSKGGKNCEVDITYFNQCAVMILGNKKYNTASAATKKEATELGMQTCSAEDVNCRVYYADCSMPERIQ